MAVQTTVRNLRKSVDPAKLNGFALNLKRVNYLDSRSLKGVLKYEDCFFIKRKHFGFEKEIRLSLDTYSRDKPSKDTSKGYYLPVRLNELVCSVVVHPDSEEWFNDVVVAVVEKFNLHTVVETGVYGVV